MSGNYFISSCGTGIGKTLVTSALCHQLRQRGEAVLGLKPVASGFSVDDETSDTAQLIKAQGLPYEGNVIERISPWRFTAPLAPSLAAAREGRTLELAEIIEYCTRMQGEHTLLVEGVGGVMAPLTRDATVLDWMRALGWPVILVCGTYLGGMSHALTAAHTLHHAGLRLAALIVSESECPGAGLAETASEIEKFLLDAAPVVQLPRLDALPPWQSAPPLDWILRL